MAFDNHIHVRTEKKFKTQTETAAKKLGMKVAEFIREAIREKINGIQSAKK